MSFFLWAGKRQREISVSRHFFFETWGVKWYRRSEEEKGQNLISFFVTLQVVSLYSIYDTKK